jgi:hypothetical protein
MALSNIFIKRLIWRDKSIILEFSSKEIDFKLLEAQIYKRTLQKEWKAAKDTKT